MSAQTPAPAAAPAQSTGGDPSGQPRPVEPGRLEKSAENSGLVVGEKKTGTTTATTADDGYKTEFVKVYQDAGVVGVSMLTLLVLCLLLGLFCTRLLKMYISLTESRDTLEAARTQAIEKLTTAMVLLRSETNTVVAELRRDNDINAAKVGSLAEAAERHATAAQRAHTMLERVYDAARDSAELLRRAEAALENPEPRGRKRAE